MSPGRHRRGPELPYELLCGVVPCRGGWLVAGGKLVGVQLFPDAAVVTPKLFDVVDHVPSYSIVTLAAPIGLPDRSGEHGRECDREARRILGWPRMGAVTSPPSLDVALNSRTYADAVERNGGHLSPITWGMVRRAREVRDVVETYVQRTVYEVHPELSFYQLNEDRPLIHSKRTELGEKEREALLVRRLPGVEKRLEEQVAGATRAQLLDAYAALWTARRIAAKAAIRIPEAPTWNSEGLRMEIVR